MKTIPHPEPHRRLRTTILTPLVWLCAGIALGILVQWLREERAPAAPLAPPTMQTRFEHVPSAVRNENTSSGDSVSIAPLETIRALIARGGPLDFVEIGLLIRKLDASECESALWLIRRIGSSTQKVLLDTLAGHWAKLNPYAAFDEAEAELHDNDWSSRIGFAAGAELAARDPLIALERIRATRNKGLQEKAAEWILPSLVKTNPKLATDFLKAQPYDKYSNSDLYMQVAREYGRKAPREALAWTESLTADQEKIAGWAWIGWAEANAHEAAAEISAGVTKLHPDVYGMVAGTMSLEDPFAALRWAQSLTNRESQAGALRQIQIDTEKLGPEGARDFIMALENPEDRMNFAPRLAQQLAREDVTRALMLVESLPDGDVRYNALDPVINAWAARDPAAAARYVATLPEDRKSAEFMRRSIHQWHENEPDAAIAFIEGLPAGENRDLGASAAINAMREANPQRALELFESVQDPVVRGNVAKNLAASLVKTDPVKALSLAAEIPAKEQPDAYKGLVKNWAQEHPEAAGAWINNLPPGQGRDAAVGAYVSIIDGMDPALATKWAFSIADPIERIDSAFEAFSKWVEKDRAAASAWLETTADIPERQWYEKFLNDEEFAKRIKD